MHDIPFILSFVLFVVELLQQGAYALVSKSDLLAAASAIS
jgi:hypothetical protein